MKYLRYIKDIDPAARSILQILLTYPTIKAMINYKIAHFLWEKKFYFLAEMIMKRVKKKTGIEIHPASIIGKNFFIDHGVGAVIGETSVIGNNCTIYQGAVLGSTGKTCGKRHPTIGDNVVIGAGAIILGDITIGDNVKVGAGAIVLDNVENNTTIVSPKAKVVKKG